MQIVYNCTRTNSSKDSDLSKRSDFPTERAGIIIINHIHLRPGIQYN